MNHSTYFCHVCQRYNPLSDEEERTGVVTCPVCVQPRYLLFRAGHLNPPWMVVEQDPERKSA